MLPSQVEEFTRCASAIEELVQHVAHGLAVMSRFWKSNDGGGGVAVGFLEDISGNGLKFRGGFCLLSDSLFPAFEEC